jgi:hypothetical protein
VHLLIKWNGHLLAHGREMIHHQVLQDFPDKNQVLLHKNNKINFTELLKMMSL